MTSRGLKIVKNIWERTSESKRFVVTKIKQFLNDMEKWELISVIYSSFPETTKNSDVVEDFQKERKESAVRLYKKNKISLERGATVAGVPIDDFIQLLKTKHIPVMISEGSEFEQELSYLEHSS